MAKPGLDIKTILPVLRDSNMRRWLSWMHANKIKELALNEIEYDGTAEAEMI